MVTTRFLVLASVALFVVAVVSSCSSRNEASRASEVRAGKSALERQFDAKYQAWLAARAAASSKPSNLSYRPILPEQIQIQNMGPRILPFLFRKLEDDVIARKWDDALLTDNVGMVYMMTFKGFAEREWPEGKSGNIEAMRMLYVRWWNEGREYTSRAFRARYEKWDYLLGEKRTEKADAVLEEIRLMGLEVLPLVMDEVSKGDDRLIPFVNKVMRKKVLSDTATRSAALQWWQQNREFLTFPPVPADASSRMQLIYDAIGEYTRRGFTVTRTKGVTSLVRNVDMKTMAAAHIAWPISKDRVSSGSLAQHAEFSDAATGSSLDIRACVYKSVRQAEDQALDYMLSMAAVHRRVDRNELAVGDSGNCWACSTSDNAYSIVFVRRNVLIAVHAYSLRNKQFDAKAKSEEIAKAIDKDIANGRNGVELAPSR